MGQAIDTKRGSISRIIPDLRENDDRAADRVWTYYLQRTKKLACRLLYRDTRRAYDEGDAAQSVMGAVFRALVDGKYPEIDNRDTLWALIASITARKVAQRNRFETQQRRDQRKTVSLDGNGQAIEELPNLSADSPLIMAELEDTRRFLLEQLDDPELCRIAELRLQGYNLAEISSRLDLSRRTVDRRLAIIRNRWQRCFSDDRFDSSQ